LFTTRYTNLAALQAVPQARR